MRDDRDREADPLDAARTVGPRVEGSGFDPEGLCRDKRGTSDEPPSMGDLATRRAELQRRYYRVGTVLLKRYRITGELGQGGMGVVFRCFDEVGGIEVALKALPPELSHNSVEMEEVRENFRLVQGLAHPNIATIKTLEKDSETGPYMAPEQWQGRNRSGSTRRQPSRSPW